MWCFQCRRRLARYLDGRLAEPVILEMERHWTDCARCREERDCQNAAKLAVQSLPRVSPETEGWRRMEDALAGAMPRGEETRRAGRFAWAGSRRAVTVAGLAAALVFLVLLLEPFTGKRSRLIKPAYALDYGIFLDGLSGRPEQLEHFAREYDFRAVNLAEAKHGLSVPLVAPQALPGGFRFQGAHLLKSGCCRAAALKYFSDGSALYVFEQPPGHPSFFGHRKIESSPSWCTPCKVIRAKSYQAVYWEERGRGFVIIANLSDRKLVPIVAAVRAASPD